MKTQYYPVRAMINMIPEPNYSACIRILKDNKELFEKSRGSSRNHQAWQGGYIEHVEETMNIAIVLYGSLLYLRHMPFTLADALLVLFLHDIEKPWKYTVSKRGSAVIRKSLVFKERQHDFRSLMLRKYRFKLTFEHRNALKYVEGEGDDHSPNARVMQPLGAFCHMADTCSARMWPTEPKDDDTWKLW